MRTPAIFFDKDGTLIDDVPYNVDPQFVRLTAGAEACLPLLQAAGFRIVVVSNQDGIAHGRFTEQRLAHVEARLRELLLDCGVHLCGFYYCPHHPDGSVREFAKVCACRKPAPGLLLKAADDLHLDLERSWMIGDILNDVEAGRRAGCQAIHFDNGNETAWIRGHYRRPHFRVRTLVQASQIILARALFSKPSELQETGSEP